MQNIVSFLNSLNPSYVILATNVVMIITAILMAMTFNELKKSEQLSKSYNNMVNRNKEAIVKNLRRKRVKSLNYEEVQAWMLRTGLDYMMEGKLSVIGYLGLRLFFALFFMIVGFQLGIVEGLVACVIGWYALEFVINESDKTDNKKMLSDIKTIYDTLRIQTKAGVYITSVLTDCYLVVENKRLKKALLELTSDIVAKNELSEALESFKKKFNNEYINTLVIVINQSLQTGQATKMFDDIREQIEDIDIAMMQTEKTQIKVMTTIVQFLIYGGIILLTVFVAASELTNGLNF